MCCDPENDGEPQTPLDPSNVADKANEAFCVEPDSSPSSPTVRVRVSDLQQLQDMVHGAFGTAWALRMLADLHAIPDGVPSMATDDVERAVRQAFLQLEPMLRLLADGMDARTERALALLGELRDRS